MFLEITTCGYGGDEEGTYQASATMFVGPFKSDEQRALFREHWDRQLNSGDHNPNQVKFLSCDALPKEWSAVLPKDFRGFQRIPLDDVEELDDDL